MQRALVILRSALAIFMGGVALVVLLIAATMLWLSGGPPTTTAGWVGVLAVEALAGLLGAMVATWLAPRAASTHGWLFGGLVFAFNVLTVTTPEAGWLPVPGVLLLLLVPPQTWGGIRLGHRLRRSKEAPEAAA